MNDDLELVRGRDNPFADVGLPEADKKKMLDEHVKTGNLFWIEVAIYNRGEFLHDPEVFQDSRKVAFAHFDLE